MLANSIVTPTSRKPTTAKAKAKAKWSRSNFSSAQIRLTGSDEGVYAWVVANYALGTLGGDPLKTTGIIELGGASAQVTFVSRGPIPTEFSRMVKFGNISYNLYSHSLLQFGQNVAFDLLRESLVTRAPESATESLQTKKSIDPCTPSGYSHDAKSWTVSHSSMAEKSKYLSAVLPKGNFSECRSAALMLLQKGKEQCSYQHCYIGSTFIPKLQGKFLTTENFFYTSKVLCSVLPKKSPVLYFLRLLLLRTTIKHVIYIYDVYILTFWFFLALSSSLGWPQGNLYLV
ncbi:hypothetical protein CsSME_00043644 [Camellia sinensis var. sinensis]